MVGLRLDNPRWLFCILDRPSPAMSNESAALFLLSDAPIPVPLRPWVRRSHGVRLLAASALRQLKTWRSEPASEHCWLVDGSEPGQWQTCVCAMREAGWLDELPWALWLPEARCRTDDESNAWEQGAVEVFDAGQGVTLTHCIEALLQRLRSPHGQTAQLRLRRAEQRAWRASLDNIPAPIFIKNADGVYTEGNQAFIDYLGLTREQVIGKTVFDVAPPELAQVYDAADRRLLEAGTRQIYDAQVRWADGNLRDVTFYKAVFHDANGAPMGQAGAIFDITDSKRMEGRLRTLAETDVLTGLLNRRSFIEQADRCLHKARVARQPVTVMLFDLDYFKQINDQQGHAVGDAVLRHISQLIGLQLRADDLLARIGGDEFAILLQGGQEAQAVAQRLPRVVAANPLGPAHGSVACTISLGAVIVNPVQHSLDELLNLADQALYQAKHEGRNLGLLHDHR
jgi:diguanylate cyclase (GGDEF)-like protein/PAS domain S-box-containing protein